MSDYLEDIQTFLTTNSFVNVFIDGFVIFADNATNTYNQINIQSEPITPNKNGLDSIVFGVYVKNIDKETGKNTVKDIRKLLLKSGGKLVNTSTISFKRIWVETEPYFWGVSQNNENIYLVRFGAYLGNQDINKIYNRVD